MNSLLMFLFGGTCGILISLAASKIMARKKKQLLFQNINTILDAVIDKVAGLGDSTTEDDSTDISGKVADENTVVDLKAVLESVKDSDFLK